MPRLGAETPFLASVEAGGQVDLATDAIFIGSSFPMYVIGLHSRAGEFS